MPHLTSATCTTHWAAYPTSHRRSSLTGLSSAEVASTAAAAATPGDADGYAWQQYDYCAAQSELTCNDGGPLPSRKCGRDDDDLLHHYAPFLPLSGMRPSVDSSATATASTSARWGEAPAPAPAVEHGALASELLWRLHGAVEVDALVRAECDRLRARLEQARKRQRQVLLVQATLSALARRLRETEAQLEATRWRSLVLEEWVRVAAAEAQAWYGVARGNEAVAAGLQATLDVLLLRSTTAEGFGDSESGSRHLDCPVGLVNRLDRISPLLWFIPSSF